MPKVYPTAPPSTRQPVTVYHVSVYLRSMYVGLYQPALHGESVIRNKSDIAWGLSSLGSGSC